MEAKENIVDHIVPFVQLLTQFTSYTIVVLRKSVIISMRFAWPKNYVFDAALSQERLRGAGIGGVDR